MKKNPVKCHDLSYGKWTLKLATVNTGEQTLNEIIFFCNFTEACQLSNFLATTVSNNFPYKPVILETYLTQQNWSLFKDGSIQSKKKHLSCM